MAMFMHRAAPSPFGAGSDVVGIAGGTIAYYLGKDPGAPLSSEIQFLKDYEAGPLAHDEPVTLGVEGTAGAFGLVVARRERLSWR